MDKEFTSKTIENFWEKYPKRWQEKGWIIAQHGLNHNLSKVIRTEFSGKSFEEQYNILQNGYDILRKNEIIPRCFFAPAHTFDKNTVKACKKLGGYEFISDGYSFYPYLENDMLFLPSVFDTPHVISNFGIFTFVYHPNNTTDKDLAYLERFLIEHKDDFDVSIDEIISKYSNRKKSFLDYILQIAIFTFRKVRRKNEK